jgi:hypothetical protein
MLQLDPTQSAEILALAGQAHTAVFSDEERTRWRALTGELLELLKNISPGGSERRRFLRTAASVAVDLVAPESVVGLFTSTIGGGGLSIAMATPVQIGTLLELRLRIPNRTEVITAKAVVVWQRQTPAPSVGAEFVDLGQAEQDLLEATVVQKLFETKFAGY